jgi:peptide/nickel transport system substrate-binding protein
VASGLLTEITDSTGQAARGGRFVWAALQEPTHFDGIVGGGNPSQNIHQGLGYEAMVRNKPGIGEPSTWSEVLPHLAESWEVSPDKMTITFHLRPGVKFHNKAPVDGRALDAEDVVHTWQGFEELSANAGAYSNNKNPGAPISSITAPNASTVVLNLAMPHASILQRVANTLANAFAAVYPKEYGDTFDARHDIIGTGPYMLDVFTPSVGATYKRNPEYWDSKAAFLDEIEMPLLPEYAARLAQLQSGAVSAFQVSSLDVVPTKKARPGLAMYSITEANSNPVWTIRFGWLPVGDQPSPFLDIRARQAISMSLDRELYIDTFGNVSNYESEGLPVSTYWHTSMGYLPEITLDPRDAGDFGENAKYYEYNVEEAKKLMDAAKSAYPGGEFPALNFYTSPGSQVAEYAETSAVLHQAMQEIGYNLSLTPQEGTEFNQNVGRTNGQYGGLAYHGGVAASRTAIDYFLWRFYSKDGGTGFLGIGGTDGRLGDQSGDAEVDALIEKLQGEYDPGASRDIMHELQRYLARQAYCVPRPGFADSFVLAWPAIRSFATFQGDTRVSAPGIYGWPQYWYDSSQPHGA